MVLKSYCGVWGKFLSPQKLHLLFIPVFFAYPISHCFPCNQRNVWLQRLSQLWCSENHFCSRRHWCAGFSIPISSYRTNLLSLSFLIVVPLQLQVYFCALMLFIVASILLVMLHHPSSNAISFPLSQFKSCSFFMLQLLSQLLWEEFPDYSCFMDPIIL